MTMPLVERDERTTAVEGVSYRWSYKLLSFGLLVIVAVRSFAQHEQSWDLLALVVLGGVVNAAYQGFHHVLYKRWVVMAVVTLVLAALVAVGMTMLRP